MISDKLYSWGRGKFVKKLYKKEPSPSVKAGVFGAGRVGRGVRRGGGAENSCKRVRDVLSYPHCEVNNG